MTGTTDLLLPEGPAAAAGGGDALLLLPDHGDLHSDDIDVDVDDDDAAGYAAMMSELPTIVSMSGLLDDDFDELNEIQNLLAPPVSDDDDAEDNGYGAAPAMSMSVADQAAQDAYIQSMVPNPIPAAAAASVAASVAPNTTMNTSHMESGTSAMMSMSGFDVSAAAAALDEELGFPSASLMTGATTTTTNDYNSTSMDHHGSTVEDIASMSTFSVLAPAKRVHPERTIPNHAHTHTHHLGVVVSPVPAAATTDLQPPFAKKAKLDSFQPSTMTAAAAAASQTPATIRTSLDGVRAPNPLLFGRPISFPTESSKLDPPPTIPEGPTTATAPVPTAKKPKALKVSLKPRPSSKPKSATKIPQKASIFGRSTSLVPPSAKPATPAGPRQVVPAKILKTRKFLTPETSLSYSAPPCLAGKLKEKAPMQPPLCKLMVKGKIEATIVGTTESALAKVPAPPLTILSAPVQQSLPKLNTNNNINNNINNNASSATASNKKKTSTSNKKKKHPSSSSAASKSTTIKKKTNPIKTTKKTSPTKDKVAPIAPPSKTKPKSEVKNPKVTNVAAAAAVPPPPPPPANDGMAAPPMETLMVANPLANVLPTAPAKYVIPPKAKSKSVAAALALTGGGGPAVVSSNNSAASFNSDDQDMDDGPPDPDSSENTSSASKPTTKSSSSSYSKPLTVEQRAQACRDRNRQHARNTRLRKKAYVEELKDSLNKLVEERDQSEVARTEGNSKTEQLRQSRRQVLQDFLQCRGQNQRDSAKWEALVQDTKTFRLVLPVTKFQTIVNSTLPKTADQQVLVGIQDAMADASYLASFLQSLGSATEGSDAIADETNPVYLDFNCDESPFLMDNEACLLNWKATTLGAVSKGATKELSFNGSIKGMFCLDTSKLSSATIIFDTGAIQEQLVSSHHHHQHM